MMGMTNLRKVLPLILLALVAVWTFTSHHSPLHLQPAYAQATDCSFTRTFTGNLVGASSSNISGNTPCVNWRITLSTTGTLSSTVEFQTSPDNITFTAVPNTLCAAAVQPPCIFQGANPITGTQGMVYMAAYGSYVRVVITSSSGTGTGTIRGYGAKGATASASISNGAGTGTVTNVSFTGGLISVANPTTAPAFTVAGTSGGIPYFSSASTWASSGALTQYFAILGGGAGNPPTSSVIKDDGTAVTINQNSVVPFTSVAAGAVANTLVLNAGIVIHGGSTPLNSGTFGVTTVQQQGTTFQSSTKAIFRFTNDSGGPAIIFDKSRGTTLGSMTAVQANDGTGGINFAGSDGTNFVRNANIVAFVDGPVSSGIVPGSLRFFTATTAAGTLLEKMRITADGCVDIGITAGCAYSLDVSKGVGLTGTARFKDQTITTGATGVFVNFADSQTAASTILTVDAVASFASINVTTTSFLFNGKTCTIVATVVTCV